jgi:hypothetical protein
MRDDCGGGKEWSIAHRIPRSIDDQRARRKYLSILIEPIRICAKYEPKMGQGSGAGQSLSLGISGVGGKVRTLYLDGRIEFTHVRDDAKRRIITQWVADAARELG